MTLNMYVVKVDIGFSTKDAALLKFNLHIFNCEQPEGFPVG